MVNELMIRCADTRKTAPRIQESLTAVAARAFAFEGTPDRVRY